MKKIPTLFTRVFEGHRIVDITDEIAPGCEEAFKNGVATVKIDGSCCAIINGVFYKRYDAKNGKTPPEGAIPCCEPDPVTGHWPHWVKIDEHGPDDKWFRSAYRWTEKHGEKLTDGTYEAIGRHFNSNPYGLDDDRLIRHGIMGIDIERNFDSIRKWLDYHLHEGIVFWLNDEPVCKIKRTDFGLKWPIKKGAKR